MKKPHNEPTPQDLEVIVYMKRKRHELREELKLYSNAAIAEKLELSVDIVNRVSFKEWPNEPSS